MEAKQIEDILSGISQKLKEGYISNHYPGLYSNIISYCNNLELQDLQFKQKFYHYVKGISEKGRCQTCEGEVRYRSYYEGYAKFCSAKCSAVSDITKAKRVETVKEIYGVDNVSQSAEVQKNIEKTFLKNYGTRRPAQNEQIKKKTKDTVELRYGSYNEHWDRVRVKKGDVRWKAAREQQKETNLKKYNQISFTGTKEWKESVAITCKEKYNEDIIHWSQATEVKDKKLNTIIEKIKIKFDPSKYEFISYDHKTSQIELKCIKCAKVTKEQYVFIKQRNLQNIPLCTHCIPYGHTLISNGHREVLEYIKTIYKGATITNDRRVLGGQNELDIYVPSLSLGIEFSGLYFHSELFKHKLYHKNKSDLCKSKNVRLIDVWEDEWKYKREIVKSKLSYLFGMIPEKLYARKCIIQSVDKEEEKLFLNENHLQGYVGSSVAIGLYMNKKLVQLMTFGKPRRALGATEKKDSWELLRFCSKLNSTVIGGASKLFKHFTKNYNFNEIISYADARWSEGNLYKQLGMNLVHISAPNYWYVIGLKRQHRFTYRKDILIKQGFDKTLTEHEIMLKRGIRRIYDQGNYKFILINKNK